MILLASASARRADLLRQIGVTFLARPVDLDESPLPAEGPVDYVERLAIAKAREGWQRYASHHACRLSLGADTTVTLGGQLLGKPGHAGEHRDMMLTLGGRVHEVLSAVAVTDGEQVEARVVVSQVRLRSLTPAEMQAYWDSGEPADKAGGYAIQGLGSVFVESIQGSYSSVVGLPLLETAELLSRFGEAYWLTAPTHE